MKGKGSIRHSSSEKNNTMKKESNLEVEFNFIPNASPLKREQMFTIVDQIKEAKKDPEMMTNNNQTFLNKSKDMLGNVLNYFIESIKTTNLSIQEKFEKRVDQNVNDELSEVREKIALQQRERETNANLDVNSKSQDKNSMSFVSKYSRITDEEKQKIIGDVQETSENRMDNYRTILESMKDHLNLFSFSIPDQSVKLHENNAYSHSFLTTTNTRLQTGIVPTEETATVSKNIKDIRTKCIIDEFIPESNESKVKVAQKPTVSKTSVSGKAKDKSGEIIKNLMTKVPTELLKGVKATSDGKRSPGKVGMKNQNQNQNRALGLKEESKAVEVKKKNMENIKISDSSNVMGNIENVDPKQSLFYFKIPENQQVAEIQKSIVNSLINKSIPIKFDHIAENTFKDCPVVNTNARSIHTLNTGYATNEKATEQITGEIPTLKDDESHGSHELISPVALAKPEISNSEHKPFYLEMENAVQVDEGIPLGLIEGLQSRNKVAWDSHIKENTMFSNYDEIAEANMPRQMIFNTNFNLNKKNAQINKDKRELRRQGTGVRMLLEANELYNEKKHNSGKCVVRKEIFNVKLIRIHAANVSHKRTVGFFE